MSPSKAIDPFEVRIAAEKGSGSGWRLSAGEHVPAKATEVVRILFLLPRYCILHASDYRGMASGDEGPNPALLDELVTRGYSRDSVKLSLFMKGHGTPRKPRVLLQRPGRLLVRWGWLPYDRSPDISGTWQYPAQRADLSLVFSMLSQTWRAQRGIAADYVRGANGRWLLEDAGLDLRTLDFVAKRPLAA